MYSHIIHGSCLPPNSISIGSAGFAVIRDRSIDMHTDISCYSYVQTNAAIACIYALNACHVG